MKKIIQKVPIPTAGVALGLASLGILLQPYSEIAHIIAGLFSLCLIALLGAKIVLFPRMIREDLKSPIFAGVFGTLFMTLMLLATYLAPYLYEVAFILWGIAILAHFCLMVYFTASFFFRFDLKQVFPSYFIAYVGIITASLTSPAFGMQAFGLGIFWFGFACYAALLVLVSYRYLRHEVPEPAKPLFCIYAAPMSLSLAGYLSVSPEPSPLLVIGMLVAAQLFLALVVSQLPKFLRLKFYPSYAAMTFPFVISASALGKAAAYLAGLGVNEVVLGVLGGLAIIQTVLATVMVLYVFARYMSFFFRRSRSKQTEPALS